MIDHIAWHPFLVHFPIAFWLLGSLVLVAGTLTGRQPWLSVAWFLLALGGVTVIPAVLSGQADYAALSGEINETLETHRDWGNALPWLMWVMIVLKAHNYFKKEGFKVKDWIWCIWGVAVSIGILYAGVLGGAYVYERAFATH
ncbi:DUF2231 domain-containing protein [Sulfidibacter corallicola]|uniref:DUF2231 domain-containing protein n=1 Tax=Sulfidibacter corallicola TaxID=2818388 RepID=A0A8A4TTX8_SULCO|nr:DUF2231 domain-containing protein [Sulfidibacter corallicola]QTD52933.1 hypothetical protein J3U87_10715 [Sulfidibacter corallicola]